MLHCVPPLLLCYCSMGQLSFPLLIGGSVLSGVKADLYLTGEMSHHAVLEATSNGICVILSVQHPDILSQYCYVHKG